MTSESRWLMMVSTAIDVLPVARSPMISSRWPRPSAKQRVDDEQAGFDGLRHEVALDDRGRRPFDRLTVLGCQGLVAIERPAERVDDAAQQSGADGNAHDLTGAGHAAAGLDPACFVEDDDTDPVDVEGQRKSELPSVKTQEFIKPRIGQAGDEGDAVGDPFDPADGRDLGSKLGTRQRLAAS